MAHSLFSASASERWANCPGSLAMSQGLPNRDSAASREGTAMHSLGEHVLNNPQTSAEDFIGHFFNEIEITDEMAAAVDVYVEYVRGLSGLLMTEVQVSYAELLGVDEEEGFGTGDALVLDDTLLHVCDAKFGRRYVEPKDNKQLTLYAAGAVAACEAAGETIETIRLHIIQPRVTSTPVPFELTREQLRSAIAALRFDAQLAQEALMTYPGESDPQWEARYLRPGEKQCQWCLAAPFCNALRNGVSRFTEVAEEFEVVNKLTALPPERLAEWQRLVPMAEIWIEAVEHEVKRRLTRGERVPGYKMVLGREGNRRWEDEQAAAEEFKDVPGAFAPAKLLSPAKLEKVLKKEADRMAPFVVRNPARPTLTTSNDPRAEWSEGAGNDEFPTV